MQEINKCNIFDFLKTEKNIAICVTTNHMLRNNGNAIMGAGIAKAALKYAPDAEIILGKHIQANKLTPCVLHEINGNYMLSFTTKNDWRDKSKIDIIINSCYGLIDIKKQLGIDKIYLPPVGCGLGGLNWSDVKTAIKDILDDDFTFII